MRKDVSKNPFAMFFGKISGTDLTGNKSVQGSGGLPSAPTRNNSLDDLVGDQAGYFGNNDDYDFYQHQKYDCLPNVVDPATHVNSRLDLVYELPSTKRVNRFNAQNG